MTEELAPRLADSFRDPQGECHLSWKVALPTTWLLIRISTRYVPTPSAL